MFEVCKKYMVPSRQYSSLKLPSPKRGEKCETRGGKGLGEGGRIRGKGGGLG